MLKNMLNTKQTGIINAVMSSNAEKWWYPNQRKIVKVIILVGLLVCFGYFVTGVWQKFASQSTNFKQSIKRSRFFTLPTSTVCFIPSLKKSVIDHYNISQSVYETFFESKNFNTTYSLSHLFNESSYWLGKDFKIYTRASTNHYNPIELHIGVNTVPFCEVQVSDILSLKWHGAIIDM